MGTTPNLEFIIRKFEKTNPDIADVVRSISIQVNDVQSKMEASPQLNELSPTDLEYLTW